MEILITSSSVRIHPPSKITKEKWLVEEFDSRKLFNLPKVAVSLLIYCLEAKTKEDLINESSSFYGITLDKLSILIDSLIEKKLIIFDPEIKSERENNLNSDYFNEQYQKWHKYNWGSAAEYHFFTYNYPFLDYSKGGSGWNIANQRMDNYSENGSDINRIKAYPKHYNRMNFPLPFDNITDNSFELHENTLNNKDLNSLMLLSAFGFAQTAEAKIPWKGSPLIRRTSPSGGSRHPTEGYLLVFNFKDIDDGLYHIQSSPFCFVELNKNISTDSIDTLFPEHARKTKKTEPIAIFILTSVFERNMFRYREPRTFRTVHMDAGHILGTIDLIGSHLNINTCVSHQFNEKKIEDLIGIDGLTEGVMTSVGVF